MRIFCVRKTGSAARASAPWIVLALILGLPVRPASASPHPAAESKPRPPVRFVRGIAFGHYSDIRTPLLVTRLREIRSLGANYVSFVVSWSMRDVRSPQIARRRGHTPPDKALLSMANRAHAQGLRVLLFPLLEIRQRKPLEWRGTLKPSSWDKWWRSYRRFMLHYARIAQRARAEMLCVGSELVSTEKMRTRWSALIAEVRALYTGPLIYSANWDHYKPVAFWDLVDFVGLTGYYRLAKSHEATEATMLASWQRHRDRIVTWSRRLGRPVLFTEVGYPSVDGGSVYPWDYTRRAKPDLEEQRRAYSAFSRAWSGVEQLKGVFFWDWYGKGGPKHTGYTPRGKPAESLIRRWFGNLAAKHARR